VLKRSITNAIKIEEGDQMMVQTISRKDLKDKVDRGDDFVLVETLPEEQYRHTYLPGALNLPPDRLRELVPELLPDKETDIVVYCGSPTWDASEKSARELADMGYKNIRDYAEGKKDWVDAGLPTEGESSAK
jgi:rhodanese-related sulfurtransferase